MKRILLSAAAVAVLAGCAAAPTPKPIAYLALEKPKGVIQTAKPQELTKKIHRGGIYVGNYNFRPAVDVADYLEQAQPGAKSTVLRNVDVKLNIPFAIDLLFCGYNGGNDLVTVAADAEGKPAL